MRGRGNYFTMYIHTISLVQSDGELEELLGICRGNCWELLFRNLWFKFDLRLYLLLLWLCLSTFAMNCLWTFCSSVSLLFIYLWIKINFLINLFEILTCFLVPLEQNCFKVILKNTQDTILEWHLRIIFIRLFVIHDPLALRLKDGFRLSYTTNPTNTYI